MTHRRWRPWRDLIAPNTRFWLKVWPRGDCWEWRGSRLPIGYGQVNRSGVCELAHRVAYVMAFGAIPDGKQLHHLCWHRWCVRPSHLLPVTAVEHRAIDHL